MATVVAIVIGTGKIMSEETNQKELEGAIESSHKDEGREGGDHRKDRGGHFDEEGDRKKGAGPRSRYRKRVLDTRGMNLDYKNQEIMEKFISRTGKILPRRMTGANARIQRKIARELKRSRMIAIIPFSRR